MINFSDDIEYYDATSTVVYSFDMDNGFSIGLSHGSSSKCNMPRKYSTEYSKPYTDEDHIWIINKPKPHHSKKRKVYEC